MTVQTDRQPIGFWLKLLDRLIDTRLELSLGGLSRRHWQVLNVVRQGRTSQAEIDARVRPFIGSEGTAAREVADLQQRGWVSPGTAALELTEPGTNEFERLLTLVSDDRTTLMNGIAPEEYASTVSVLERMARNLGWTPPKAGSTLPTGGQS
jgi:DNA-binding MarR family transcriptional regulator